MISIIKNAKNNKTNFKIRLNDQEDKYFFRYKEEKNENIDLTLDLKSIDISGSISSFLFSKFIFLLCKYSKQLSHK